MTTSQRLSVLNLGAISIACATPGAGGVRLVYGAADVRLLSRDDDLSTCKVIDRVAMQDGSVGGNLRSSREANKDRLIARLKNRVIHLGGNAALIERQSTKVVIDRPGSGTEERLEAVVYSCSGSHISEERSNNRMQATAGGLGGAVSAHRAFARRG